MTRGPFTPATVRYAEEILQYRNDNILPEATSIKNKLITPQHDFIAHAPPLPAPCPDLQLPPTLLPKATH